MDAQPQETTSSEAPAMSLLDMLMAGIASINIEAVESPEGADERPDEVVPLGVATEHMRRVAAFHRQLTAEVKALTSEGEDITRELLGPNFRKGRGRGLIEIGAQWFRDMLDGGQGRREKVERLATIEGELHVKKPLVTLAHDAFWAEAHRHFPAVLDHPVTVLYSDWSIGAPPQDDSENMSNKLFGLLFGEHSPFGSEGADPDDPFHGRLRQMLDRRPRS